VTPALPRPLVASRAAILGAAAACAVILAALAVFWWQRHTIAALRRDLGAAALAASNADAARDSTRRLTLARDVLADSLAIVQRRAVQAVQTADALDRALGLERVARLELTATVRELRAHVAGTGPVVSGSGGALSQTFDVDSAPYHVRASVTLAPPPATGSLDLAVMLRPIPLAARLGCGAADARGIRPASVSIVGPVWATVVVGAVTQAPEVCRSPALTAAAGDTRSTWRKLVDRVGVSAGVAAVRAPDGHVYAGPGALAGVKIWP
jgi:hypothetical protein